MPVSQSVLRVSLLASLLASLAMPVYGELRSNRVSSSAWYVWLRFGSGQAADRNAQILILIFAEVLGLYGLIVALIMNSQATGLASVVSPILWSPGAHSSLCPQCSA